MFFFLLIREYKTGNTSNVRVVEVIKICENVKNLASLIDDSIKRKIPENFYDDFIETHIGKFDGKNSERIANLILGLK